MKLTKNTIESEKLNNVKPTANVLSEKQTLITLISRQSDRYGNKLLEFMEKYHLVSLQEATVAQLHEYVAVMEKQRAKERDDLIKVISAQSDEYHDKLQEFLDAYHLTGLCEATAEQLRSYVNQRCQDPMLVPIQIGIDSTL